MKVLKYVRIFSLNFQQVFAERGRSFVWFLLSLFGPMLMLLFWRGANLSSSTFSIITSYYFLLVIGGSLLMSHSEENIALIDIQEGRLSTYLLKPFAYFILKWLEELPYRALQGTFGIVTMVILTVVFHFHISVFKQGPASSLLSVVIILLAISMAQLYKVCLGFISFWTTDTYGIFQLFEILTFVFAGYIVPLSFYPYAISVISYILPFSYMIYFPVAATAGFFTIYQLLAITAIQIFWIVILIFLYKFLWTKGVKAFTGVGQ